VIEGFRDLPEVETNLFEPALYQIAQAGLAAGDLKPVTNALTRLLAWYPRGFHTDHALLLAGQEVSRQGNPAQARQMFLAFTKAAPDSSLRPAVELAVARTYEQEGQWNKRHQAVRSLPERLHERRDSAASRVLSRAGHLPDVRSDQRRRALH